jgi:hypothetical protein
MPEGLTWAQLIAITRTALETGGCRGWSIGVYNPDLDPHRRDAERIVAYLAQVTEDGSASRFWLFGDKVEVGGDRERDRCVSARSRPAIQLARGLTRLMIAPDASYQVMMSPPPDSTSKGSRTTATFACTRPVAIGGCLRPGGALSLTVILAT